MKRITVSLPDDLAAALSNEATRRRTSVSATARSAIEAYLARAGSSPRHLPFAALGRSGHNSTARRIDELLLEEWTRDSLGGLERHDP